MSDKQISPNNILDNWFNMMDRKDMRYYRQYINMITNINNKKQLYQIVFNELIIQLIDYHRYLRKLKLNDLTIQRYHPDRIYFGRSLQFSYNNNNNNNDNKFILIRPINNNPINTVKIVNGQINKSQSISKEIQALALDGYESMMTLIMTRIEKFNQDQFIVNRIFKTLVNTNNILLNDLTKIQIKSILTCLDIDLKQSLIEQLDKLGIYIDPNDKKILLMDLTTFFYYEYYTHYEIGKDKININMSIEIQNNRWNIPTINMIN